MDALKSAKRMNEEMSSSSMLPKDPEKSRGRDISKNKINRANVKSVDPSSSNINSEIKSTLNQENMN